MRKLGILLIAGTVTIAGVGAAHGSCVEAKIQAQGKMHLCLANNQLGVLAGNLDGSAACATALAAQLAKIDANAILPCRFVDNGDATVSDLNTGLMWEQTTGTWGAGTGAVNDVNNRYTWEAAHTNFLATLNKGLSTDGGTDTAITGCFANHCDWRLPSIVEFQGILKAPFLDPTCVNHCMPGVLGPEPLGSTAPAWSESTKTGSPLQAWRMEESNGFVTTLPKQDGAYVRAVRNGF